MTALHINSDALVFVLCHSKNNVFKISKKLPDLGHEIRNKP